MGVGEEEHLCKGIVVFMAVRLNQSLPFIVQVISEVTINGQWLAKKISDNIGNLIEIELFVRGIVTDKHLVTDNL